MYISGIYYQMSFISIWKFNQFRILTPEGATADQSWKDIADSLTIFLSSAAWIFLVLYVQWSTQLISFEFSIQAWTCIYIYIFDFSDSVIS